MTYAGLKKVLCQVSMNGDKDQKDLELERIIIKSLFIEAGFAVNESDLVDHAVIVLSGPAYAVVLIAVQRNATRPREPQLKDAIQAASDKFEFNMKKHQRNEKTKVTLM